MDGIIIVDKPHGFTSFDVIAKLRGILGQRKIGHGGTLDPMATGVLLVFLGTATKAVDLIPGTDKRYTAAVQLGFSTDTGDITGTVTEHNGKTASREDIENAAKLFLGKTSQIPPMYSAVKIDGQRLYKLAREGKTAQRKPREIEVFDISVLDFDTGHSRFVLDVHCSKGTYIRTLAENIAAKAGCLGTLVSLRRTLSAGFGESAAVSLDDIESFAKSGGLENIIIPIEKLFESCARVDLDQNLSRLFLNGFTFDTARTGRKIEPGNLVAVYGETFLGLAESDGINFKKIKQFSFPETKQ